MNESMARAWLLDIERKIGLESTGKPSVTYSDVIQNIIALIESLTKQNDELTIQRDICADKASKYEQAVINLAMLLSERSSG